MSEAQLPVAAAPSSLWCTNDWAQSRKSWEMISLSLRLRNYFSDLDYSRRMVIIFEGAILPVSMTRDHCDDPMAGFSLA